MQRVAAEEHAQTGKHVLVISSRSVYTETLQGISKERKVKFKGTKYRVRGQLESEMRSNC